MSTSTIAKFQNLLSDVDNLTLAVTILVAVVGWLFALWLQRNNAKHEHKIQVRYDIYKQLLKSSQETQGKLGELGAISPPLILMESSMIPFNLKLKKEYKEEWIPYSEHECISEGGQKWLDFIREAFDKYFAFVNQNHEMLIAFEGWEAALESLMPAQKVFSKEVSKLSRKIHGNISKLQMYSSEHDYDWRKWNKEEIESIANRIRDDSMTITTYVSDLMTLVHNELLSNYFNYQKPIRKTLDPKYKVLTSEGLILRLEDDHERKLKEVIERNKREFEAESEEGQND